MGKNVHSEAADVGYVTYILDFPVVSLIKSFQSGHGIISESLFLNKRRMGKIVTILIYLSRTPSCRRMGSWRAETAVEVPRLVKPSSFL